MVSRSLFSPGLLAALLVACGSGNPVVSGDVAPADLPPDAMPDAAPPPDTSPDTPNAMPDVAPSPDTSPDAPNDLSSGMDVPVDIGPPRCREDNDCMGNAEGEVCDTASGRCVRCIPSNDRCPAGQYCVEGTHRCAPGCRDDRACTDPGDGGSSRTAHCNPTTRACVECITNEHCPLGNLCVGNACVPGCNAMRACPAGRSCCDSACVDTQSSIAHCGACGTVCSVAGGAPACRNGRCTVSMCTPPNADCDGDTSNGCETDTRITVSHCGACGMACSPRPNTTASCTEGMCRYTCAPGFADCDGDASNGCEIDTRTSSAHCGACGARCAPPNATGACRDGTCTVASCNEGFGDCDGNATNGCETDTRITVSHCGACGRMCSGTPNAVPACALGTCALTCTAGFADCDGNATNGCEVDTRSTASHCGGCGRACALPNTATATCRASTCSVVTCATHFGDCDDMAANGCETDLRTSTAHCGACGRGCTGGTVCTAGTCTPLVSCAAILARFPGAASGVYTIDPDGSGTAFGAMAVYCDMGAEGGGWTMVYKLSSGVAGEPSRLWNGGALHDDDAAYLNTGRNAGHFVSRLLGGWNTTVPVAQVRLALYNGATESAFLRFNGAGSNRTNWFVLARVLSATWTDLASQGQNFFQIEGLGNYGRHWFINRNYGGCPADTGWLVVNGSSEITCDWATRAPPVNLQYARGTVVRNWNDYANIGLADTLAVFIR